MSTWVAKLDDLSSDEKLQLLERLWDSLSREPAALRLTEAQRRELDRRLDELEQENEQTASIPWEDVVRRIREPRD